MMWTCIRVSHSKALASSTDLPQTIVRVQVSRRRNNYLKLTKCIVSCTCMRLQDMHWAAAALDSAYTMHMLAEGACTRAAQVACCSYKAVCCGVGPMLSAVWCV